MAERGYEVSVPFGDNQEYDIGVDDAGALYRVQCKTAWERDPGTIQFNTHSRTTRNGEYHETAYKAAIDAFVIYQPGREQLYWIDIEDATTRKMKLRYVATIDHPAINWAKDFELGDEISRRTAGSDPPRSHRDV